MSQRMGMDSDDEEEDDDGDEEIDYDRHVLKSRCPLNQLEAFHAVLGFPIDSRRICMQESRFLLRRVGLLWKSTTFC